MSLYFDEFRLDITDHLTSSWSDRIVVNVKHCGGVLPMVSMPPGMGRFIKDWDVFETYVQDAAENNWQSIREQQKLAV